MALEWMTRMDAKNCQIWQVLHFQTKIVIKSEEKIGMIGDGVRALITWSAHFLNMVIKANIARKIGKMNRHDIYYC